MAINITSILNAITAKNNNADSTYSNFELSQINTAVNTINNSSGVITYRSVSELPSGDSSTFGQLAFIDRGYSWQDSDDAPVNSRTGSFYYYDGNNWSAATLTSDSNYANQAAAAGLQGLTYGYATGGVTVNIIQKFPFASEGKATDVGDLTVTKYQTANSSSSTHGYSAGGVPPKNIIDKFPFTVDANATDVGDLLGGRASSVGMHSFENGYVAGGTPPTTNIIQKYSFAADGNSTDVGDLLASKTTSMGANSLTHGYSAGGSPAYNVIQKFPFSVDANATDVGDLLTTVIAAHYNSSSTHGYTVGGQTPPYSNVIQKYAFATDGNSTDVGDFIHTISLGGRGPDYTTHGYQIGGNSTQSSTERYGYTKHSFLTDENSTDVGELVTTNNFYYTSGNHV